MAAARADIRNGRFPAPRRLLRLGTGSSVELARRLEPAAGPRPAPRHERSRHALNLGEASAAATLQSAARRRADATAAARRPDASAPGAAALAAKSFVQPCVTDGSADAGVAARSDRGMAG